MTGNKDRTHERGTTILEATVVLPWLLISLVVFFDLARLFLLQWIVTTGAKQGLNQALKLAAISCDTSDAASVCVPAFNAAQVKVLATAKRFPLATMFAEAVPGGLGITGVYLLRPGNGSGQNDGDYPLSACGAPPAGLLYQDLMLACPLGVRIVARMESVLPFVPVFKLKGEAFGFREAALSSKLIPEVRW